MVASKSKRGASREGVAKAISTNRNNHLSVIVHGGFRMRPETGNLPCSKNQNGKLRSYTCMSGGRMTIQQAAREALDVQNACNLSGVLRTFNQVVTDAIWPEARRTGNGTIFVNSHPVVTLFLHKLTSLNGCDCFCSGATSVYTKALIEVENLAKAVLR